MIGAIIGQGGAGGSDNVIISSTQRTYCGLDVNVSGSGSCVIFDSSRLGYTGNIETREFTTSLSTNATTGRITIDGTQLASKYLLKQYYKN